MSRSIVVSEIELNGTSRAYPQGAVLAISPHQVTDAYFAKKVVAFSTVNGELTVSFERIDDGNIGREVYIIVETDEFQGENIKISVKTNDTILTGAIDACLSLVQGNSALTEFTVTVGNKDILNKSDGTCDYTNLSDFDDKAILKLDLRPQARADFNTWAQNIANSTSGLPELYIEVWPEDAGTLVVYGGTGAAVSTRGKFLNGASNGFSLDNRIVYEIYHPDNLYNPLGTHTYRNAVVRRRIGKIENEQSTQVKYFYHNEIGNCYEICECELTLARERNTGYKHSSTSKLANLPAGYATSQAAPAGGDAMTNYYYNDPRGDLTIQTNFQDYNEIISIDNINAPGTDYGIIGYSLANPNDPNILAPLVRMPDNLNIDREHTSWIDTSATPPKTITYRVRATFSYSATQRRYCNPGCFAGFIGVLIQLGRGDVVCTGMCFGDATSYPSVSHPNGKSVDTEYLSTLAIEQLKVNALRDHYFATILCGSSGWFPQLTGTTYHVHHETHLHSGGFAETNILILNH
jgi:hypothetical protein